MPARLTFSTRNRLFSAVQGMAFAAIVAVLMISSSFRFEDSYASTFGYARELNLSQQETGAFALVIPTIRYGLELERYGELTDLVLPQGASVKQLLADIGLSGRDAQRLGQLAEDKLQAFGRARRNVAVLRDSVGQMAYVMIELDGLSFLRIDLQANAVTIEDADGIQSQFATMTLFYNGSVDSMLAANSFDGELANQIRKALLKDMPLDPNFEAGLIKLIYTAKYDDLGVAKGYGDVEAVRYSINGNEHTTFRFADDGLDVEGFFNPDGSPVKRTWLNSPVANSVISSPYNLRRLHPVLQTVQPHYGVDYAANFGAPVVAITDGIVVARASDGNNGNFVKIEHDKVYSTQYLHLKGFARNLRPGKRVQKGDIIGYVGSTGLSSGPHVCLRFWKNGQQVDFQRELKRLPQLESLSVEAMAVFEKKRAELDELLLDPRA